MSLDSSGPSGDIRCLHSPAAVAAVAASVSNSSTRRACGQCRARKVKCDRADDCCGPCSRLSLNCSYSHRDPAADNYGHSPLEGNWQGRGRGEEVAAVDSREITQAGIKRRRTRCACAPCRAIKAKCSGDEPCARCRSRGLECVPQQQTPSLAHSRQPPPVQPRRNDESPPNLDLNNSGLATPVDSVPTVREAEAVARMAPSSLDDRQGTRDKDKEREQTLIQAYFDKKDTSKCIFLHAPTTWAQWARGELDPILVKTICAAGLFHTVNSSSSSTADTATASWFQEAKMAILTRLNTLSLPWLQALVLIIDHHFHVGEITEAWNLLPLAARMALTLKLNYERNEGRNASNRVAPAAQESRRRLMWHIYFLDRNFSGGLEDLEVCPVHRMLQLRLPCEDRTFERDMPSRARYLIREESEGQGQEDMDIYSYILRIYASRDKILRYTKRVCRQGVSPVLSKMELVGLETELGAFAESLPADIQLNTDRLDIMARSRDFSGYIRLYTVWLQCYCDLYRFLVPGLRESVSQEAMHATPQDYVSYCQHNVLARAVQLCSMWVESFKYQPHGVVNDIYLGVSAYQVSQIVGNLRHLLVAPDKDNHDFGTTEDVRKALQLALAMVHPSLKRDFPRLMDCLREVERVIQLLGLHVPTGPSPSFRLDTRKDSHHLISKGSVIPVESSDSEEGSHWQPPEEGPVEPEQLQLQQSSAGSSIPASGVVTGERIDDDGRVIAVQTHSGSASEEFEMDYNELHVGMMPWDPFAVQAPDDYDPVMGMLGLYTTM